MSAGSSAGSRSTACARSAATWVSASDVRADSGTRWRAAVGRRSGAGRAGGSASTTWQLVPLKPKLLTVPTRTPFAPGSHGVGSRTTRRRPPARSSLGLASAKPGSGGSVRWRRASTTLSSPAIPAAVVVWPMLAFTEPRAVKPGPSGPPSTWLSALTSIGSPRLVAVPCASTYPMSPASTPALRCTARSSSACEVALGAVMPLVRPSPLTPLALITAWTRSPSASAALRFFNTTAPTPSPSTMPSAPASKGTDRPVGESIPTLLLHTCICGVVMSATPPATASSQSPPRIASQARWTAVSEEEHAVSTVIVGPLRSSR